MSTVGLTRNAPQDSVGKVATLWAGPGEASNSTASVDVSCGSCIPGTFLERSLIKATGECRLPVCP